jgi:hypothetical protein
MKEKNPKGMPKTLILSKLAKGNKSKVIKLNTCNVGPKIP